MFQYRISTFVALSLAAYLNKVVHSRGVMWRKLSHIQEETFSTFNAYIEKLADFVRFQDVKSNILPLVVESEVFLYETFQEQFTPNAVPLEKTGQFTAAP